MAGMKLYLSSHGIPDVKDFLEFVGKPARKIKFGLIMNAKDHNVPVERAAKRNEMLAYFKGFGLSVHEIDLRDYYGGSSNSDLIAEFRRFDVLWLNGGNTYSLRWALAESKAEQPLEEALKGGVIYGGNSAGAIVAGPTLKYFDNVDDPSHAPQAIYKGLGLIDRAILPHWGSKGFGKAVKSTKRRLERDGYQTIALTDGDALTVEVTEVSE